MQVRGGCGLETSSLGNTANLDAEQPPPFFFFVFYKPDTDFTLSDTCLAVRVRSGSGRHSPRTAYRPPALAFRILVWLDPKGGNLRTVT